MFVSLPRLRIKTFEKRQQSPNHLIIFDKTHLLGTYTGLEFVPARLNVLMYSSDKIH